VRVVADLSAPGGVAVCATLALANAQAAAATNVRLAPPGRREALGVRSVMA
jgi:hypothetical protein